MLLPVGWAPGPDPASTRKAELLFQMVRPVCPPTAGMEGGRGRALTRQKPGGKRAPARGPGAWAAAAPRSRTRLPHKAREAQRCPGAHSVCVSECGLTPEALRSEEAERPALGAACRFTQQGVSLG